MAKTFSKDEVASHNKGDNLWVIIDQDVYDVSKFQEEHPGEFRLYTCARDRNLGLLTARSLYRWKEEYDFR